jgi:hypothetical protein
MRKWIVAGILLAVLGLLLLASCTSEKGSGTISGRVIAEDTRDGVAGVTVSAVREGKLEPESGSGVSISPHKRALFTVEGVTDNNGWYELKGLKSGKYAVFFNTKDRRYIDAQKQRCLDVHEAEKIKLKDFILRIGGSVSGTIYGPDGKAPLSGVLVTAKIPGTEAGSGGYNESFRSMETAGNGQYLLHGLPDSNSCIVTIEAPEFEPLTRKVKIQIGKVTSDINFKVDKRLIYVDGATGILVNVKASEDKLPLSKIHITFWNNSTKTDGYKDGNTDENGQYLISGISAGLHQLSIFRRGSLGDGWDERNNILVKEGKTVIVNVELDKREPKKWKDYTCE